MKYTINDLRKQYPDDDACLEYLFNKRFPNVTGYYRVKGRKCYSHKTTRHQIFPLAGTIFEKSSTALTLWFHAIFLFSTSKNGVSAKELQRQLGVTYKCAWRIAFEVRTLMAGGVDVLSGTVEIDETYMGGRKRGGKRGLGSENKTPVFGMVERKGNVKAKVMKIRKANVMPLIQKTVVSGSNVMSDEFRMYRNLPKLGFEHGAVAHWKREYVRGNVHTNTIEGFWSQMKRSIDGTYHSVSPKHLQHYVDEFVYRYNHRASLTPVFSMLMARI